MRRFGRSVLSLAFRAPVLLLHTTGRTSGVDRTTTLAYDVDGDRSLLVVGGAGGQVRILGWVGDLRAYPRAAVTVDRERVEVTRGSSAVRSARRCGSGTWRYGHGSMPMSTVLAGWSRSSG